MAWLIRRVARRRCYSVDHGYKPFLELQARPTICSIRRQAKGHGNRSFTMSDHGLRRFTNRCAFGFLLIALGENCKVHQCGVRVFSGSGGGFSIQCRIGTADVSRAPRSLPQTPRMVVAAAQPQVQPNFGGGFIEFLFGDSAQQPQRGPQQWYGAPPRGTTLMPIRQPSIPCRSSRDRTGAWILASYARRLHTTERKRPARSLSIRRTIFSIWSRVTARRYATASASAAPASPGQACTRSRQERMAGLGAAGGNAQAPALPAAFRGRRPEQSARARARSISARRSTASTARTSLGRSAKTCRPAASACAMRTSSTSMNA